MRGGRNRIKEPRRLSVDSRRWVFSQREQAWYLACQVTVAEAGQLFARVDWLLFGDMIAVRMATLG